MGGRGSSTPSKMTYKQLEQKVVKNRLKISKTTDAKERQRLVNENHDMMMEMDRRWK